MCMWLKDKVWNCYVHVVEGQGVELLCACG